MMSGTPRAAAPVDRRHSWTIALGVVLLEVAAAFAAAGTFTLSTVPEVRAATRGPYLALLGCALLFLVLAVLLWRRTLRAASVLLAIAAVGTALGAVTWVLTVPLALVAAVLTLVWRRPPSTSAS